jgi:hypothetical protein
MWGVWMRWPSNMEGSWYVVNNKLTVDKNSFCILNVAWGQQPHTAKKAILLQNVMQALDLHCDAFRLLLKENP